MRACETAQVTKGQLRHWKRSPHFRFLHDLTRTDKRKALRELSLTIAVRVLDAVEWLLDSPKGSDKAAGAQIWERLVRAEVEEGDESGVKTLIQVLNYRGELPEGVQKQLQEGKFG